MSRTSVEHEIAWGGGTGSSSSEFDAVEHESEHSLHWETSYWPLVLTIGILFLLPFSFTLYFVYAKPVAAMLSLGIGAPLTVISIAGWISEGVGQKDEPGYVIGAMPFFILAEAFIFIAFFAGYWLVRLMAPYWPPEGTPEISITIPLIMTAILVASSFTIHHSEARIEKGDRNGFLTWLVATIILGVVFMLLTLSEYSHLMSEGFNFKTNIFSTAYYSITGFHFSHVLVGVGMFICILIPALMGKMSKSFVKAASMYWHFVDIIWFFVVTQIYFWS
ncbi:MAG: heme-copper oxidase subunit III [Nitrospirae bacterium]|nr:heme-copper oxidase subunit III [Nitrospirota bacterium]